MKKVKPPIQYRIWFIVLLVAVGFFGVLVTAFSLLLWPIAFVLAVLRIVWSVRQFKQRSSHQPAASSRRGSNRGNIVMDESSNTSADQFCPPPSPSLPQQSPKDFDPKVEAGSGITVPFAPPKVHEETDIDGKGPSTCVTKLAINFSCPRVYTKDAINKMLSHYIALDLETTGLNPDTDKIIEISAIVFKNGCVEDKFSTLVNPNCHIPSRITKMTGISDSMVENAPDIFFALKQFKDFLDKEKGFARFVAHNARFDLNFLKVACEASSISMNYQFEDTLRLAKKLKLETPNKKLETLCEFYNIDLSVAHRSENDATACGHLFRKICDQLLSQNEKRKSGFSANELEYCGMVKQILCDFGVNTDLLSFRKGTYLTAHVYSPFLKLKLGPKIHYALIDNKFAEELNVPLEKASKSETESHYLRMPLETPYDLLDISPYIVDKCANAEDDFRSSCVFSGERVLRAFESLVEEGISI